MSVTAVALLKELPEQDLIVLSWEIVSDTYLDGSMALMTLHDRMMMRIEFSTATLGRML